VSTSSVGANAASSAQVFELQSLAAASAADNQAGAAPSSESANALRERGVSTSSFTEPKVQVQGKAAQPLDAAAEGTLKATKLPHWSPPVGPSGPSLATYFPELSDTKTFARTAAKGAKEVVEFQAKALGKVSDGLGKITNNETLTGVSLGARAASSTSSVINAFKGLNSSGSAGTFATGLNAATGALGIIKGSTGLGKDLFQDALVHQERGEFQRLIKDFDPTTRQFFNKEGVLESRPDDLARLESLTNAEGADRTKSRLQVAGDRFSQVKDLAISGGWFASSVISLAGHSVPGVGVAMDGATAANAIWKSATHITALNNATLAEKSAGGDPLLEAISEHIKQERTFNSRKQLVTATISTASFGLGVAGLATGVGFAGSVALGAVSTANVLIQSHLTSVHDKALKESRAAATDGAYQALVNQFSSGTGEGDVDVDSLKKTLSKTENIGLVERALIDRLQNGTPEQVESAVKYLANFGLSKQKITQLRLTSDPAKALESLRKALYTENVKFSFKGLKAGSGESFLRIVGLHKLGSRIQAWRDKKTVEKASGGVSYEKLIADAKAGKFKPSAVFPPARLPEAFRVAEGRVRSEKALRFEDRERFNYHKYADDSPKLFVLNKAKDQIKAEKDLREELANQQAQQLARLSREDRAWARDGF
jgi:hypothetical protein